MTRHDPLNAYVAHGDVELQRTAEGPLADRTFALKDFFDLAGVPTGAGSPHWLASHETPTVSTPCVDLLLDAGAYLKGKTHTDEMAWSLNGENHHYGTPVNPAAPGRIPGGSSSGSAAVVAGRDVDFAIGSDTGGSVRLPASYCGIIGIRTTHGRIPITGAVPLAPSYDTLGWFARDAELFAQIGEVLLGPPPRGQLPRRLIYAEDLFSAAGREVGEALHEGLDRLSSFYAPAVKVTLAADGLGPWRNAFRLIQSAEAWAAHGEWIAKVQPEFGPGVRERFAAAAKLDQNEVNAALALREDIRKRMDDILGDDGLLVLPTGPGIAPRLATPEPELDAFRARALELLCPAGHAGLPQISLPLGTLDGCPVGLSVMAPRGRDEALLELAKTVMAD
ncbi:amidase [Azorhizobium oxalatiphilum]|uniref:Amidase n=1 Tax=Azorhizobium oxalatiphilum TaxID=980631 RepID=A0A917CA19_9HYPH|nr:amidase [Azorhizobium oxalatiphilum]GGF80918.1 amidase [Azorhizobium oxalatiphilum]